MSLHLRVGGLRVAVLVCLLGMWGCGEDPHQLFETAKFEEQQGNTSHAKQLYEQILKINPEGELAAQAKVRLEELGK